MTVRTLHRLRLLDLPKGPLMLCCVYLAQHIRRWPRPPHHLHAEIVVDAALFEDLGHQAGCDGSAALADIEALTSVKAHGVHGVADHLDVVARHGDLAVLVRYRVGPVKGDGFVWTSTLARSLRKNGDRSKDLPAVRTNICG